MFIHSCPRCQSSRIQLGFNDAPALLRFVGVQELLCNNCNLEFKGFVAPFSRLRRARSTQQEVSVNRRRAPRFKAKIPVHVAVILTEQGSKQIRYSPTLVGQTHDISKIGLALILPAIRVGKHDFTDANHKLWIRLELPSGYVTMRVVPVHHTQLNKADPAAGYLIGVHIKKIDEDGHARFFSYIDHLA
ncbi:MAG TPA: PilZ domain-containing protein [Pyrinomonadaceae bacterium]|nr:PilZ domain-containing protein [Pyrinomonadaceae bacterium]